MKRDLSSSKCIEYNPDDHKDRYIDQLEQHLSANKSSLEETKKMFSKNQNEIRPMMNHIERIFETIECDR